VCGVPARLPVLLPPPSRALPAGEESSERARVHAVLWAHLQALFRSARFAECRFCVDILLCRLPASARAHVTGGVALGSVTRCLEARQQRL
jgi:hypothetical protein